jgi:hypothetical protein
MTRFRFGQEEIAFVAIGAGPLHNPLSGTGRGRHHASANCAFLRAEYWRGRPAQ